MNSDLLYSWLFDLDRFLLAGWTLLVIAASLIMLGEDLWSQG